MPVADFPDDLLSWTPPEPPQFFGESYVMGRDGKRLNAQTARVHKAMKDGQWHTLSQIALLTGDPEASCSARLRTLRHHGFEVLREYLENGLWRYRMTVPQ